MSLYGEGGREIEGRKGGRREGLRAIGLTTWDCFAEYFQGPSSALLTCSGCGNWIRWCFVPLVDSVWILIQLLQC